MSEPPVFEYFNQEWADRSVGARGNKGINAYLGIVITEFTPGRLVAGFDVTDEVITMIGNIHGGCVSTLVDTARLPHRSRQHKTLR